MGTLLTCVSAMAQSWPDRKPENSPGSRWWWPGSAVDRENISWNMEQYAKEGIRELEITPIYGVKGNEANDIDFLSHEWMEMLRFVEEEGRRTGIQIDMNFGTGWPFGGPTTPVQESARKVVTDTREAVRGGSTIEIAFSPGNVLYPVLQRVMAYPDGKCGDCALNLTDKVEDGKLVWRDAPEGDWTIMALYVCSTGQKVSRAAPGGEGYVIDHFDAGAVRHYLQKFTDAFDTSGVPCPDTFFNDSYEVYGANWTPGLFDEFHSRRGYLLENYLPELFTGKGPSAEQVLIDYRQTLSELLYENFTTPWVDWIHSRGARVRNQAHGSPGNLIDLYAAVDIPEIEGFGLSEFGIKGLRTDPGKVRKNFSDLSMLKYASSASHITGKPLASSETFTWLTEHFRTSLSQLKPDLDLMFCAGVNRILFHGTCYSPKDEPWPGWRFYASIDMSPNNTIWHDAPWFMEYVTRCQSFLQGGRPDNDFLIYVPIMDMWSKRNDDILMMFEISNMDRNAPEFIQDVMMVDKLGYDCDYISDRFLMTTTYRDGMLETAAGTRYKALILPGVRRMPEQTRKHIEELKAAGAAIITEVSAETLSSVASCEEMKSGFGLNALRRRDDTGYFWFIANLTPNDVHAMVPLSREFASAAIFNPVDGSIWKPITEGDKVLLDLRSGESVILKTYDEPVRVAPVAQPHYTERCVKDLTSSGWTLEFSESAPAVDGKFKFKTLRTWEGLDTPNAGITMGTGAYTTTFRLTREEADTPMAIDLGDVRESARVWINGKFVGCAWAAPFTLDCRGFLKAGRNDLRIEVTNLPANRIADMDRRGVQWRKFKNINVVDINYKHTTYEGWDPVPSGLNSTVSLVEIK